MTVDPIAIPLTQVATAPLRRFGKYYLVRKLAKGGMAEIYLAKQVGEEGFERDVVVKCMLDHFNDSREFVSMFLDEARLAARLFHPNIVQITDLGVAEGRYYICMEYLPGEDLQTIIERCTLKQQTVPPSIAAKVILSACEGLEFAHRYEEGGKQVSLVHRDVSPSNIIVTYQGIVKVVDFGIAKASSKLVQTQPGTLKGKWGYMSPEQARGEPLDCRSDLFSLGITFYELLTGQRVFVADNEVGLMFNLMAKPVPVPSKIRPDIPQELDDIVIKATHRNREERYADAAAFRADLLDYLAGSSSLPGGSDLAAFMQMLFGRQLAEKKIHIPTLKEMLDSGEAVLPPEHSRVDVTAATFVRGPGSAVATAPANSMSVPEVKAATSPEPQARWAAAAIGAVGAVVLLILGAGTAWFLLRSQGAPVAPPTSRVMSTGPVAASEPSAVTAPTRATVPSLATGNTKVASADSSSSSPVPVEAKSASPVSTPNGPAVSHAPLAPASTIPIAAPPEPARLPPAITLTYKKITAVFEKAGGERIQACGERHRTTLAESEGRVVLTFTVKNSGAVREAHVAPPLDATVFGQCVVDVVKGLHFPRNLNKPESTVELRFKLRPTSTAAASN